MANEITLNLSIGCANGSYAFDRRISNVSVTQSALGSVSNIQSVGFAAAEALVTGDITTPGYAIFRNLDATNFVTIGDLDGATFTPVIKLAAGEPAMLRVGCTAARLAAKADTGAVKLEYTILEA